MAILSKLHKEQLSVFLRTEQLILYNICHSILENSILFDVVNLARAVDCNFWRRLCNLVLNEFPVGPIYFLSLNFALYTPFKSQLRDGQFILFLELQVLFVCFSASKIFLLCELMMFLILGKQLYEILVVLKILWNLLFFGKMEKKTLRIF